MTTIDKTRPVLVTGANGYIASWIVKQLLDEGHTVNATVRDPAKASAVGHLRGLAARSSGKLNLFKADLLEPGSFDAAARDCELVMHTASPFLVRGFRDANEALVRPAVEGTRNVLESANRAASVKRVVLTSSVAAIYGDNVDLQSISGDKFTEEHWNTTSSVEHQPYSFSKLQAEREALRMNEAQSRWDLVSVNPAMVYGPSLTKSSQSASLDTFIQFGNGKLRTGVPRLTFGVVDVRDVARAHLVAGFTPAAHGRYILAAAELSMLEMSAILRARHGDAYPFPRAEAPTFLIWALGPIIGGVTRKFVSKNVGHPLRFDNSRSKSELGLHYRPVDETLLEHFQQLIDDGLLAKKN